MRVRVCVRARAHAALRLEGAPSPRSRRALKRGRRSGAEQSLLGERAPAMAPPLWASCLFPLFLGGLAQPAPKPQTMRVSVPLGTQRTAAPDDSPGLRGLVRGRGVRSPAERPPAGRWCHRRWDPGCLGAAPLVWSSWEKS